MVHVSDEEFNTFHAIDRELFARLIHELCLDRVESAWVMAFFIFIDRVFGSAGIRVIRRLNSLAAARLGRVADEAALCLRCLEDGGVAPTPALLTEVLTVADAVERLRRWLWDDRESALSSVSEIVHTVCARAFLDLMLPAPARQQHPGFGLIPANRSRPAMGEVGADDRTVFLTFSKGYPIPEDEVREFFTRKFGNFIEDLIMQEVGEDEQVLYARMVAWPQWSRVIDQIVGSGKEKYNIHGKHVWARKYVKKHHQHHIDN